MAKKKVDTHDPRTNLKPATDTLLAKLLEAAAASYSEGNLRMYYNVKTGAPFSEQAADDLLAKFVVATIAEAVRERGDLDDAEVIGAAIRRLEDAADNLTEVQNRINEL